MGMGPKRAVAQASLNHKTVLRSRETPWAGLGQPTEVRGKKARQMLGPSLGSPMAPPYILGSIKTFRVPSVPFWISSMPF